MLVASFLRRAPVSTVILLMTVKLQEFLVSKWTVNVKIFSDFVTKRFTRRESVRLVNIMATRYHKQSVSIKIPPPRRNFSGLLQHHFAVRHHPDSLILSLFQLNKHLLDHIFNQVLYLTNRCVVEFESDSKCGLPFCLMIKNCHVFFFLLRTNYFRLYL